MDSPFSYLPVVDFYRHFPCRYPHLEEHRGVADGEVRRGDFDGMPTVAAAVRQAVEVESLKGLRWDVSFFGHGGSRKMDGFCIDLEDLIAILL